VLLTTRGQVHSLRGHDIRVFKGRESTGVRGIKLASGDEVVSLALARPWRCQRRGSAAPICAKPPRRDGRPRRSFSEDAEASGDDVGEDFEDAARRRLCRRSATRNWRARAVRAGGVREGFGKRTSSYEYRTIGAGAWPWREYEVGAIVAALPRSENRII